jgi:hypothetical protein
MAASFPLPLLTAPVEVYRNLNAKGPGYTYSVRQKGKVIAHLQSVTLRDCTLVVQPGGRDRVRREKRKNVHAYIKGYLCDTGSASVRLTYDPYSHDTFVTKAEGAPVRAAAIAVCTPEGVYVGGIS